MGGCNKGDRCPFSHELVQVAPKGVDVSNGFYISGNVANYKATSTAASPSSPNSGRRSGEPCEAGNASSANSISTLTSSPSYSVAGVSLSAEAKEWVSADSSSGAAVASWGASAATSTSSVQSQRTVMSPVTRTVTASPPYTTSATSQAPPLLPLTPSQPQPQPQPQRQRLVPDPQQQPSQPAPQPVQYNRPPHQTQTASQSALQMPTFSLFQSQGSQPPSQQPLQTQQQPAAPLPPQPRSVAIARHALTHTTPSPGGVNKYTAPSNPTQTAPPAAVVGKYSVSHPVIQNSVPRSVTSLSSLSCTSMAPFSPVAAPVSSPSSSTPSSTCGHPRRELDVVPTIVPTAPPRYTASSTVIASPPTPTPTPTITNAAANRFPNTALLELPMTTGTLAAHTETPLPRSREVKLPAVEHASFAFNKLQPTTTQTLSAATSTTPAAPPLYETKTMPATVATTATVNAQNRVVPPAPRSQQQQQQQQAQLRAQLHTQQQQQQQQFHQTTPQQQAQPRQYPQHQQQQPPLQYHLQVKQTHVQQQQQQQCQYQQHPQQTQQQQTVYLMAQPRSAATTTPSRESPAAAASAASQLPCGYSLAYALPTNATSPTQMIIAEQPSGAQPTYTALSPSSPQAQQQGFPQSKSAVLYLSQAQGQMPALNSNTTASVDKSAPRYILVKADGTFTVLQTAF
ncbi:hypothetical protein ABL78_8050 [Leptomonas seymouri]|uniref:C3H1-type domain-containing protein n=1 Tax=Leptomonas seymouri TaxID=5684 RepID=A0A0N0P2G8_LEPSE|nr:hypothetical protein ABL78_8050 [Leptomonas seymouri]|eukprot:KPI82936.1 hypothetical protein ABL78_8050 [Leptomonas seymouri]